MSSQPPLRAPFPYFGGKSKIAPLVWERFGTVKNYVEPFFGSGAVLLGRPDFDPAAPPLETVNDFAIQHGIHVEERLLGVPWGES